MNTPEVQWFIGEIKEVTDPLLYEVLIDIPGVVEGARALPLRGEIDEPKPGNIVLVRSLDPLYGSLYIYSKLKENDFIGFRSNGKAIDITPDHVTVGIFDDKDYSEGDHPEFTSFWKIDSKGNLTGNFGGSGEIKIKDTEVTISGGLTIKVTGNCELSAPSVKISGNTTITGGTLTTTQKAVAPDPSGGPFCALPVCLFTGAPHQGNIAT